MEKQDIEQEIIDKKIALETDMKALNDAIKWVNGDLMEIALLEHRLKQNG